MWSAYCRIRRPFAPFALRAAAISVWLMPRIRKSSAITDWSALSVAGSAAESTSITQCPSTVHLIIILSSRCARRSICGTKPLVELAALCHTFQTLQHDLDFFHILVGNLTYQFFSYTLCGRPRGVFN